MTIELEKIAASTPWTLIQIKQDGSVTIRSPLEKFFISIFQPGALNDCSIQVIGKRIIKLIPHSCESPYQAILYDTNTPELIGRLRQRLRVIYPKKFENRIFLQRLLSYLDFVQTRLTNRFVMTRDDFVYSQESLSSSYRFKNLNNPLKSSALRLFSIERESNIKSIFELLKMWLRLSVLNQSLCLENRTQAIAKGENCTRWEQLGAWFQRNIDTIKGSQWYQIVERQGSKKALETHFKVYTAVKDVRIFGLCIIYPEQDRPTVYHIESIISCPTNGFEPEVQGIGAAFIEQAITQSIKAQGLIPQFLPSTAMKKTLVSVKSPESLDGYYRHLCFEKSELKGSQATHILTGNNLIRFLELHGGRSTVYP
jgi:hypothetical protein